jgi:hypothetical protein
METLGIIGMILMYGGFASAAWVLIIYILSLSAVTGTKLSKKLGTSNEKTDEYLNQGKAYSNQLLKKLGIRLITGVIGWLMCYFTIGHF